MRRRFMGLWRARRRRLILAAEKRLIECLVKLASEKAVVSAHDVSDGGLAVTLTESCFERRGNFGGSGDRFYGGG